MKLYRDESLRILAYCELAKLTLLEKEAILIDLFSENDTYREINDFMNPIYNEDIVSYYVETFVAISNRYIEERLSELFDSTIEIIGTPADYIACPVCGYKTLKESGEYDICPVCYWEDDGIREDGKYSSSNRMTLKEAKANFEELGAVSREFTSHVDKDGHEKYLRND